MAPRKYILWDFDGTLAYRTGRWSDTFIEVLRQEMPECPVTLQELRPHVLYGFPWHNPEVAYVPCQHPDDWWNRMLPVFERAYSLSGVQPAERSREMAEAVRRYYLDPAAWRLFDDTLPVLELLRQRGWRHLVLSNHVPELTDLIAHLGLDPYLDRVFNSALTGYEKPNPEAFRQVLEWLGPYDSLYMVGDSVKADVGGAQSVGLTAILVHSQDPACRYCCETLTEVPDLLERLG